MSFSPSFQKSIRLTAKSIASAARPSGLPAIIPLADRFPGFHRAGSSGKAERDRRVAGPRIACDDRAGVIEIHDPRLLRTGHEAFCVALVVAAVGRFGARRAEVRVESSTCRLQFEPGRFDRHELASRVGEAVRAATPAIRNLSRTQSEGGTGWTVLTAFAIDGGMMLSAERTDQREAPALVVSPSAAPASSGHLADVAMAGSALALAVSSVVLPVIPTMPFLVASCRYAARFSPRIERLLVRQRWSAVLLAPAETRGGSVVDRRSLSKSVGMAALWATVILVLHPPLPVLVGLELALLVFVRWREMTHRWHPRDSSPTPVRSFSWIMSRINIEPSVSSLT